jgi:putative transposase
MRRADVRGKTPTRWRTTTIADPAAAARAGQARRDFTAGAAKTSSRWCGDITYLGTWEGWLYLSVTWNPSTEGAVGRRPSSPARIPT